jgi:Zn-dependent metalloprotease
MGTHALAAGKTCLRDMNDPGAGHCLSPQPASYRNFDPTADVHINSGIPNKAFATFAANVGGKTWEKAAKAWYAACTDGQLPSSATIAQFAERTVAAARSAGIYEEAANAWKNVEVPFGGMV